MATVEETPKSFGDALQEGYIRFYVVAGPEPIADRIYFEKPDLRERDDGLNLTYPGLTLQLDDSLDTFDAGDAADLRALLLKSWNATENT
jgi:hypothetical protein